MAKPLTDVAIQKLKPAAARREIPAGIVPGLYLVQQPVSGALSWAFRYRLAGKTRKLTLGRYPALSLAEARKAAGAASVKIDQGIDPAREREEARAKAEAAAANTLRAVADEYLAIEGRKLRSLGARRSIFDRLVYPILGRLPIDDIRRSDVVRLLDRIERESGPAMADYSLAILSRLFNWHASRSDDFRSPIVRGMARTKPKERARSRTLSDDELRAVWRTAEAGEGPFPRYLQFLLLTGARRNEAARLPWSEIDGGDWLLPAERSKTKQSLTRPLSGAAQKLLADLPRIDGCAFVFTSDGRRALGGFAFFKARFDQVCGVTGWTLHDLRRTARTLLSRAGISADHAERCLGHTIGGVGEIYDRHAYHTEMARAFESLAALIARIVEPPAGNVVVPLRG